MINALEKVVYPNGKTQSLAEIGGAVEGLSALIDEVDRNTSAITSITAQLSALVSDVDTNTSAISSINTQLGQLMSDWTKIYDNDAASTSSQSKGIKVDIAIENENIFDYFTNKEVCIENIITFSNVNYYSEIFVDHFDGDMLRDMSTHLFNAESPVNLIGCSSPTEGGTSNAAGISYLIYANKIGLVGTSSLIMVNSGRIVKTRIYTKTKPTPPTRTAKKKAVVKKKGDSK